MAEVPKVARVPKSGCVNFNNVLTVELNTRKMQKDRKIGPKIEKTCQKYGEIRQKLSEIRVGIGQNPGGKKSFFRARENPGIWRRTPGPEISGFFKPPKNLHHSRVRVLLPFFIFLRKGVHHPKSGFFGVFWGPTEISGIFIIFSDHFSGIYFGNLINYFNLFLERY